MVRWSLAIAAVLLVLRVYPPPVVRGQLGGQVSVRPAGVMEVVRGPDNERNASVADRHRFRLSVLCRERRRRRGSSPIVVAEPPLSGDAPNDVGVAEIPGPSTTTPTATPATHIATPATMIAPSVVAG